MEYRIEHDTLGEVKVPADHKWGAQTQRSFENFKIGKNKIPEDIIRAFAILKKCAAIANKEAGKLSVEKQKVICEVCDENHCGRVEKRISTCCISDRIRYTEQYEYE